MYITQWYDEYWIACYYGTNWEWKDFVSKLFTQNHICFLMRICMYLVTPCKKMTFKIARMRSLQVLLVCVMILFLLCRFCLSFLTENNYGHTGDLKCTYVVATSIHRQIKIPTWQLEDEKFCGFPDSMIRL